MPFLGSGKCLRARGGCEMDITWQHGKLDSAIIRNVSGDGRRKVRHSEKLVELELPDKQASRWVPDWN